MTDSEYTETTMETSLGPLGLGPKLVNKAFNQSINGIKCLLSQVNEICAQIKHRIVFIFYSFLLVKTEDHSDTDMQILAYSD